MLERLQLVGEEDQGWLRELPAEVAAVLVMQRQWEINHPQEGTTDDETSDEDDEMMDEEKELRSMLNQGVVPSAYPYELIRVNGEPGVVKILLTTEAGGGVHMEQVDIQEMDNLKHKLLEWILLSTEDTDMEGVLYFFLREAVRIGGLVAKAQSRSDTSICMVEIGTLRVDYLDWKTSGEVSEVFLRDMERKNIVNLGWWIVGKGSGEDDEEPTDEEIVQQMDWSMGMAQMVSQHRFPDWTEEDDTNLEEESETLKPVKWQGVGHSESLDIEMDKTELEQELGGSVKRRRLSDDGNE